MKGLIALAILMLLAYVLWQATSAEAKQRFIRFVKSKLFGVIMLALVVFVVMMAAYYLPVPSILN